MVKAQSLSLAQARRIALAAQGFARPRPTGIVNRGHLKRVFDQIGVVQIDSVNVVARAHYLAFFSRLGPYDRRLLDDLAAKHREIAEYWVHEASYVPKATWPLLRWRMNDPGSAWQYMRSSAEQRDAVDALYDVVAEATKGVAASELEVRDRPKEPWWDWSHTKRRLEYLFWSGQVSAVRKGTFERSYLTAEALLGHEVVERMRTLSDEEARRGCLLLAARGHGVGTLRDLADYTRMKTRDAAPIIDDLVHEGVLEPVQVETWKRPAFLYGEAARPRRVRAQALVSPFDSLVWERTRTHDLFGFHYRIEIYVPKPKRVHGYYVLPFLMEEGLRARVDLKADRAGRVLIVQATHLEPGSDEASVAAGLAVELGAMARWLDLDDIDVRPVGDLAAALRASVR